MRISNPWRRVAESLETPHYKQHKIHFLKSAKPPRLPPLTSSRPPLCLSSPSTETNRTHTMSVGGNLLSIRNSTTLCLSSSSSSLKFQVSLRPRFQSVPIEAPPKGPGVGLRNSWKRPLVAFAASHEESKHSEIEVTKEYEDRKLASEKSEEVWKQTLETFKEQALRMQSVSQEAYEAYSKKALIILKETSEHFKDQADKIKNDLTVLAKEVGVEGKEYLSTAAENSPEPVKEVVEAFTSCEDDLNEISKVRDFYLGIPYGLFLSLGGFLSFMLTGSISAIRFGVILGAALLAFSVSSLRSYKRGEPYAIFLKGQAAIATIIFLREINVLFQRASISTFLTTVSSGAVVAFYIYRMILNGTGADLGPGAEN